MDKATLIPLRWHLTRCIRALRWQGLAGLGLTGAAAVLYLTGIVPDTARMDRLQQEALSAQDVARAAGAAGAVRPVQETWLAHFSRLLPARSSAPELLRVIHIAARAQGLSLEQGDYKLKIEKNGRMVAYEVSFPLRGSYIQMRQFVADVLVQIPAAALDEFSIKRERIGDATLEASIRFTLFMNAS